MTLKQAKRFYCSKHGLNHGQKYKSCHPKVPQTIPELLSQLTSSQRYNLKQDMMLKEAKASAGLAKRKAPYIDLDNPLKKCLVYGTQVKLKPPQQEVKGWEEKFDEIGFGNQARISGGKYGAKRVELKDFIRQLLEADHKSIREKVGKAIPEWIEYPSKTPKRIYLYGNSLYVAGRRDERKQNRELLEDILNSL